MKKILTSLSIIGLVGAMAIGATMSYFSDTETSAGNIFTAGDLDLKVDHKYASYNGNACVTDCVENVNTNLILNGSFEVPEVTDAAKWQIFASGSSGLVWTVEWEGGPATYGGRSRPEPALVEYHEGVLGLAQNGDQYAELDSDWFGPADPLNGEPALVRIYQNVATTFGKQYKLHYYFAPRPNTASTENILYVRINGVQVQQQGPVSGGSGPILWTEYTYIFTASGASTKIEFAGGGTNDSLGVFLDNVSVSPMDCDYQITGGTCKLWDLKDLEEGDYFWHFNDVKPGDYGVNVISLHAFSNNAYACLKTNNIDDQENEIVDPETAAGDTPTSGLPTGLGELSQYIKVFAWEDSNQNNTYDLTDTILLPANSSLTSAMNPSIALIASNTKYIGLAWCAGTQSLLGTVISCDGSTMGNDAQTDSFTADVTAYAVQQRNNPNFNCGNIELP